MATWSTEQKDRGACEQSEDGAHCEHWWDCEPCCRCGYDGGGDDCDCPRHTAQRAFRTEVATDRVERREP